MHRFTGALCAGVTLLLTPLAMAERQYTVHHGNTVINFDPAVLSQFGLTVSTAAQNHGDDTATTVNLQPFPSEEPLTIGDSRTFTDGEVSHYWGLIFSAKSGGQFYASDIAVSVLAQTTEQYPLQFITSNVTWDAGLALLQIDSEAVVASNEMANALGQPNLLGRHIATATTKVFLAQHSTLDGDTLGDAHSGPINNDPPINDRVCPESTGPDVIVGDTTIANYTPSGGIDAFSVGTTSCNVGTTNLNWISSDNRHPVIPQNMYRLKTVNGASRFEQIGQSWMKHGFTALTQNLCCSCSGQGGSVLGVGCSDPYTAGRNGTQVTTVGGLGPRFQTNPHTGVFTFPYMFRNNSTYITHNDITRRLQVALTDLDPAQNSGASYYFEAQYVTPDDAANGNQDNNASYRTATVSYSSNNANATLTGSTQRELPAIKAWKVADPAVVETIIEAPEDQGPAPANKTTGRAILSAKATDVGGGVWNYEYALYNMNCDRAFSSFSIPIHDTLNATNIGFHDVPYHSGDGFNSAVGAVVNYDGTDWPAVKAQGAITWSLIPATPVENSNALRWGTLYNFRFRTTIAPVSGQATIGCFKASLRQPPSFTATTVVPGTPILPCVGDFDGDHDVDLADLAVLLSNFGQTSGGTSSTGDLNADGAVDLNDLALLLIGFGVPCN